MIVSADAREEAKRLFVADGGTPAPSEALTPRKHQHG